MTTKVTRNYGPKLLREFTTNSRVTLLPNGGELLIEDTPRVVDSIILDHPSTSVTVLNGEMTTKTIVGEPWLGKNGAELLPSHVVEVTAGPRTIRVERL